MSEPDSGGLSGTAVDIRGPLRRLCELYPGTVRAAFPEAGDLVELSPEQSGQFETYLRALLLWRQRTSLISTADPTRIVEHHILDSLFLAALIHPGNLVADLGSGAGLPGIPLAIVRPLSRFVLVESRRKRASFLREIERTAGLENLKVNEGRVEDLGNRSSGMFDIVLMRAVWKTDDFLRLASPLLKRPGKAIAMKGPQAEECTPGKHDLRFQRKVEYTLPGKSGRVLLIYCRD